MKPTESPTSASKHPTNTGRWLIRLFGGVAGLLATIFLVSALMHGWEYKKKLTGDYALLAVDVREQMNISKMLPGGDAVGVVRATVFAVGWNDDFIIAQQHPPNSDISNGPRVTNFYILRTSDEELWGPLTADQFRMERANQGVPSDLDFTLVFQDLK
jgi:hypothetical protein